MTKREPKPKLEVPTRAPRAKGGMFDNLRKPGEVESLSIEELVAPPESAPLPLPPPTTSYHPPPPSSDAAPKKDFTRVANSVTRDAVPAGLFRGTSKKTYDALYLRTRGAIAPRREVRARMNDLMTWCSVSHNTLREHLRHLEAVGLIRRKWELGNNDGALYEVFIPEELAPPTTSPLLPPPTTSTSSQNLAGGSTQKLVGGGGGQVSVNSEVYEQDKTLIKTNTENDDDEAFAPLLARLKKAVKDLTGKEPSAADAARWGELAELLDAELRIAAGRTGNVSSVPAFLTEHLRRRLWKKDRRQVDAEAASEGRQTTVKAVTGDVSKCPDCFGTGMWYPEGFEKGVARCAHEKLTNPAENGG